ncbi:hypothetical protein CYMTET_23847 [Cymbomonas tetramitiformis]|uniref:Uncharacterized protein n=1 Tax=Cymbomonas tetramitiformis TaxID=36881 RepID=A0AAE0FXD5_9CHLO|nr:hypothetical protein CYMTET_23847 [Cymbomonas tetramitiformis]
MKSLLLQAEKFKNEAVARSTEAVTQLSGILKKDSSADSLSALEQKSPMGSSLSLSDVESGKKVPVSVLRHRINELAKKTKKEGRDFRFRMGVVGVVVLAFLFIVGLVSLFSGGGSPEVAKEETAALSDADIQTTSASLISEEPEVSVMQATSLYEEPAPSMSMFDEPATRISNFKPTEFSMPKSKKSSKSSKDKESKDSKDSKDSKTSHSKNAKDKESTHSTKDSKDKDSKESDSTKTEKKHDDKKEAFEIGDKDSSSRSDKKHEEKKSTKRTSIKDKKTLR